jgi:hypothetical protein
MKTRIFSIIELIITVVYVWLCTRVNGTLPHSISCTAYLIPHYLDFSIYIVTLIAFVAATLYQGCDTKGRILVTLMIIGLADVALSPHYHTSNTYLHYIGGVLCCVTSVIYIYNRMPKLLLLWIPCFVISLIWPSCHIMFQELTCLLEMFLYTLFAADGSHKSQPHLSHPS